MRGAPVGAGAGRRARREKLMELDDAIKKLWTVRVDGDDELAQARALVVEQAVNNAYAVGEHRRLTEVLGPLCPCGPSSPDTQGPLQECPLHGDGTTFVAWVNWLEHLLRRAKDYCETPPLPQEALGNLYERLCKAVVACEEGEHPDVSAFMLQLGIDGEGLDRGDL